MNTYPKKAPSVRIEGQFFRYLIWLTPTQLVQSDKLYKSKQGAGAAATKAVRTLRKELAA